MIRRPPRSTPLYSSAASDVYKRQVLDHDAAVDLAVLHLVEDVIDLAELPGGHGGVDLPAGDFPASIFEIVLKGLTLRGSIVGTRQDLAEALEFYARSQ